MKQWRDLHPSTNSTQHGGRNGQPQVNINQKSQCYPLKAKKPDAGCRVLYAVCTLPRCDSVNGKSLRWTGTHGRDYSIISEQD